MTRLRSRTLARAMLGLSLAAVVMTPRTANVGETTASRLDRPATVDVAASRTAAVSRADGTVMGVPVKVAAARFAR
jgi:hypothetical protein